MVCMLQVHLTIVAVINLTRSIYVRSVNKALLKSLSIQLLPRRSQEIDLLLAIGRRFSPEIG